MTTPTERPPVTDEQEPHRPDYEAEILAIAARAKARRAAQPPAPRVDLDARRSAVIAERRTEEALAQVPARYADAAPTDPAVAAWVADVAAGRTRDSLILMGGVGTGKTHQAYGAFAALARRGIGRCAAVTVPAFLDGLRPGRPGAVDYGAVEGADLLLLDDLAAERVTDWTGEVLYRLIDARWAHLRPTIITTNATPAAVRERLGDRVASRLGGMGRTVTMTGEDRRGRRPQ